MSARYDIPDLLARVSLEELVLERTAEARRHGSRITYRCPNPMHPDAHPSFTVDTRRQRWACWSRCNAHGDAIAFLEWCEGMSKGDAIRYLADRYNVRPVSGRDDGRRPRSSYRPPMPWVPTVNLVRDMSDVDTARPVTGPDAVRVLDDFLAGRGWSRTTAERVGLSVVRSWDGYRVRFPFPRAGVACIWQDRATMPADREPKWHTPKGATLYPFGLDSAARYDGPTDEWPSCPVLGSPAVWITEGPADAVTLLEHFPTITVLGLPGAGLWRDEWTAAVDGVPVVLVADNDDAGERLRATVDGALESRAPLVHVRVPEQHNDVGEWHLSAGERFEPELLAVVDDSLAAWHEGLTA